MKLVLAIILILLSLNAVASSWNFKVGGPGQFAVELDRYLGEVRLFNCTVNIEKIDKAESSLYWLTLFDQISGRTVGLEIEMPKVAESVKTQRNFLLFERHRTYVKAMRWQSDFNGNLAAIEIMKLDHVIIL